jgi:hypothetical protein
MENITGNKELSEIILYVMSGKNYAQEIAKDNKELPSTIVRRLQKLEKYKLLKSEKEKLLNKTKYSINWSELSKLFAKFHFQGNDHYQKMLGELFEDERFIALFVAFVKKYLEFSNSKKIALEKVFDKFVSDFPQSRYKNQIDKIEDKKFRDNLNAFLYDCEDFNQKASFANSMDDVLKQIIHKN